MRFRGLATYPLLYAVVFSLLVWWLAGSEAFSPFIRGQLLVLRVVAIVGSFAAVAAFERGDHLRRAWLWLAWAMVVIFARDLLRLVVFSGEGTHPVISALGVIHNLAILVGIFELARAWKKADIPLPGGRFGAPLVVVGAALLALAVAGPGVYHHGGTVLSGEWSQLILLVSAIVDVLSLCLLAPLLLTAVALRGGLFAWPWALVTASILSWLLYDATASRWFFEFYGLDPAVILPTVIPLNEVFRGLGLNYHGAAGWAQRAAVRQLRRESSALPAAA